MGVPNTSSIRATLSVARRKPPFTRNGGRSNATLSNLIRNHFCGTTTLRGHSATLHGHSHCPHTHLTRPLCVAAPHEHRRPLRGPSRPETLPRLDPLRDHRSPRISTKETLDICTESWYNLIMTMTPTRRPAHPFAGARRARPTRRHRPAIWEAMLGTVYAQSPDGQVRYFDYDWDAAHAFAGLDDRLDGRLTQDWRLCRPRSAGPYWQHTTYGIDSESMRPRPGQTVLWVLR